MPFLPKCVSLISAMKLLIKCFSGVIFKSRIVLLDNV